MTTSIRIATGTTYVGATHAYSIMDINNRRHPGLMTDSSSISDTMPFDTNHWCSPADMSSRSMDDVIVYRCLTTVTNGVVPPFDTRQYIHKTTATNEYIT
jgi:hypothetical protein